MDSEMPTTSSTVSKKGSDMPTTSSTVSQKGSEMPTTSSKVLKTGYEMPTTSSTVSKKDSEMPSTSSKVSKMDSEMPSTSSKVSKKYPGASLPSGSKSKKSGDEGQQPERDNAAKKMIPLKHPLLLPPVIRTIFDFLPLSDIQDCRDVCTIWASVGEAHLRKLSRIVIGYDPPKAKPKNTYGRTNEKFLATFMESETRRLFTALHLKEFRCRERRTVMPVWPTVLLNEIMEDWRNHLQELTIGGIDVQSPSQLLTVVKQMHLKKLDIHLHNVPKARIPFENVADINNLRLRNVHFKMENGRKMTASKLTLSDCHIIVDCIKDHQFTINEIVDFSKVKFFKYIGENQVRCRQNGAERQITVKLNLAGSNQMDYMELNGRIISLLKEDVSNWIIDKLLLLHIRLDKPSPLKVRFLRLLNWNMACSHMPKDVEGIWLTCNMESSLRDINVGEQLPNLKRMTLDQFYVDVMDNFVQCPMTALKIIGCDVKTNLLNIPPTLKYIFLDEKHVLFGETRLGLPTIDLEIALLANQTVKTAKKNFLKFRANLIIWQIHQQHLVNEPEEIMGILHALRDNTTLVVGPVQWEVLSWRLTCLSEYVDEFSEYYIFEGRNGRAISQKAFNAMMKSEYKKNYLEVNPTEITNIDPHQF